jgi:uncharacterized protein (TIGR02646 family)
MIRLVKVQIPEVLAANADAWTADLLTALHGRDLTDADRRRIRERYAHEDIRTALEVETHGKCAYCESKLLHVVRGDIEHVVPKSRRPDATYRWDNLSLACPICNNRKRDYLDENVPLLDPYADDPDEYLVAEGRYLEARPGKPRGEVTISRLDLNRLELVESRRGRLKRLGPLVELWAGATDEEVREALWSQLEEEMAPRQEYSFAVRGYLLGALATSNRTRAAR